MSWRTLAAWHCSGLLSPSWVIVEGEGECSSQSLSNRGFPLVCCMGASVHERMNAECSMAPMAWRSPKPKVWMREGSGRQRSA